jgi:uncharacterized protein (DUF1015 family)
VPEILPFAGIRYSDSLFSADVLAPPFDVYGEELRRSLIARSEHNVVLLDKGPEGHDGNWYTQAATLKERWLADGILHQDVIPAFYGYRQVFSLQSVLHTRTGFVAAVRLAQWGQGIFPHERTRSGDRADRLQLTRAMRTNMSSVFGLYRDADGTIDSLLPIPEGPLLDRVLVDDVEHTFWRIDDPAQIRSLQEQLATRDVVIADGHHRYETALAYQAESGRSAGDPGKPISSDYVMMYLTNACAPGLVILPTHRMVSAGGVNQEALLNALGASFEIYPLWNQDRVAEALRQAAEGSVALAMATQSMGTFVLRLKSPSPLTAAAVSPETLLQSLDVVVLQERILEPLLGISQVTLAASTGVTYTTDAPFALRQVRDRQMDLAFILNATTTDQVWHVASSGLAMPQKSTFFYPKLLTGLVINPLDVP